MTPKMSIIKDTLTLSLHPVRDLPQRDRQRRTAESLDDLRMLRIEATDTVHHARVLLLRFLGDLAHLFRRDLLGIDRRDRRRDAGCRAGVGHAAEAAQRAAGDLREHRRAD